MIEVYVDLLKKIDYFSELTNEEIKQIILLCEMVELDAEEVLFRQNDPADAMYILVTGYLLISIEHENHQHEQISSIHPGELVGELGLFTKKPRSATAIALLKSKLIKLSSTTFYELARTYPRFIQKVIPLLADRAHYALQLAARRVKNPFHKHIMLVIEDDAGRQFYENLKIELERYAEIHYYDHHDLSKYLINHDDSELLNYLDHLEQNARTIICAITPDFISSQSITRIIFKRVNTLVLVQKGESKPEKIKSTCDMLDQFKHPLLMVELILLWQQNDYIHNTRPWLQTYQFHLHHHIKINNQKDYHRLIRYFNGKAIGLVLSGGGYRVWYHLGVLRAIAEAKIPIDAIGGTSSGAVAAIVYLMTNNFDEMETIYSRFSRYLQKSLFIRNLTYPLISLYNAKPITNFAKKIFQEDYIEDLSIPYFAIATNLNTSTELVIRQGLIWEAVRASTALPGIYPPLVHKGQLLFDGGLLNNLPTDHMRKLLGDQATIIASDNSIQEKDLTFYDFPPMMPLWETIKAKLNFSKKQFVHPAFLPTLIKALLVGSSDHYRRNLELVNYHICSDLSAFGLIFYNKAAYKQLIELGYTTAKCTLQNIEKEIIV